MNVIEYISGLMQMSDKGLKTIKDAHGNTALHYVVASSDNPGTDYLLETLIERFRCKCK